MTNVTAFQTISSRFGNSGTTTPYTLFYIQEIWRRYQLLMMGLIETTYQHLMQLLLAMKLMTTNINNLMYNSLMDTK